MASFQINNIGYQSKLMDGETQTLVLKRLLPTFTALVGCRPAIEDIGADAGEQGDDGESVPAASAQDMLMPVARELALLADSDVQFILNACLDVTQRQLGTGVGWAGVRQRGIVQDQTDAKFITRLTIAWHVLGENFGEMLGSFGLDLGKLSQVAPRLG